MRGIGFSLLWIQILFLFLFALIVGLICLLKLRLTLPEK
jgi:hypothetical protein